MQQQAKSEDLFHLQAYFFVSSAKPPLPQQTRLFAARRCLGNQTLTTFLTWNDDSWRLPSARKTDGTARGESRLEPRISRARMGCGAAACWFETARCGPHITVLWSWACLVLGAVGSGT